VRYNFMVQVYDDLSRIDTMLNAVDARLEHASGSNAAALAAFRRRLTYDPKNVEDLNGPAQLRERVLDLIARMTTSFQAPTLTQNNLGVCYQAQTLGFESAYREFARSGNTMGLQAPAANCMMGKQ